MAWCLLSAKHVDVVFDELKEWVKFSRSNNHEKWLGLRRRLWHLRPSGFQRPKCRPSSWQPSSSWPWCLSTYQVGWTYRTKLLYWVLQAQLSTLDRLLYTFFNKIAMLTCMCEQVPEWIENPDRSLIRSDLALWQIRLDFPATRSRSHLCRALWCLMEGVAIEEGTRSILAHIFGYFWWIFCNHLQLHVVHAC